MISKKRMEKIIFFLGLLSGVFAVSGDAVLVLFRDSLCSTVTQHAATTVPAYVPGDDSCVFIPAMGGYGRMKTMDTLSDYFFDCKSDCSNCSLNGTLTIGTCTLLTSSPSPIYVQTFDTLSPQDTFVSLYQSANRSNANGYAFRSTCETSLSSSFPVNLGVCEKAYESYQMANRIEGSGIYGFSVVRNCTDSTCTQCRNGGWYSLSSTPSSSYCIRLDRVDAPGIVEVLFSFSLPNSSDSSSTITTTTSSANSSFSFTSLVVLFLAFLFSVAVE